MSKHTPGPWLLDKELPGGIYSDDATGSIVARCHGEGLELAPRPKAEWQANARLIAAAPDMLAALRDLHSFVAVMVGRGPDATIPETVRTPTGAPVKIGAIMRDASAAIAKAGDGAV